LNFAVLKRKLISYVCYPVCGCLSTHGVTSALEHACNTLGLLRPVVMDVTWSPSPRMDRACLSHSLRLRRRVLGIFIWICMF
jgi:hypothetical protein